MSNPVLDRNPYFRERVAAPNNPGVYQANGQPYQQPTAQGYAYPNYMPQGQAYAYAQPGQAPYGNQYVQQPGYAQPFAVAAPMTWNDALSATAILLAVTVVSGALTMAFVPFTGLTMMLMMAAVVAVIGVAIWAGTRPMVSPGTAIAYTVLEGFLLGLATKAVDAYYPGAAFQAILGTLIVVAVAVGLYRSGKVRTSRKGMKVALTLMLAAIGYGIVNMVLMALGVGGTFGLDSMNVGVTKLGILLGIIMIAVAGYTLINNLETVQIAVNNRAPRKFAWTVGFGIAVTVIWVYSEVLRIIRLFGDN